MNPALVVVDMQNDFLAKGGYYDRRNLGEDATRLEEPSAARAFRAIDEEVAEVVKNLSRAVSAARAGSWVIAFLLAVYDPTFKDRPRFLQGENKRAHYPCKPQSWGAQLIDPIGKLAQDARRRSNEVILEKHTFDGFHGTRLTDFLMDRRTGGVFVIGVETHACVLATAIRAAVSGFETTIIEDCVWSSKRELAKASLEVFSEAFGKKIGLADSPLGGCV